MRTCLKWIFLRPIVEKYFFRSIFEWLQNVGGVFTFALLNIFAAGLLAHRGTGRHNTLCLKLTESLWILKQVYNKATFISPRSSPVTSRHRIITKTLDASIISMLCPSIMSNITSKKYKRQLISYHVDSCWMYFSLFYKNVFELIKLYPYQFTVDRPDKCVSGMSVREDFKKKSAYFMTLS